MLLGLVIRGMSFLPLTDTRLMAGSIARLKGALNGIATKT
jgi:hypothetical protein